MFFDFLFFFNQNLNLISCAFELLLEEVDIILSKGIFTSTEVLPYLSSSRALLRLDSSS
jgi:hypothetical protein